MDYDIIVALVIYCFVQAATPGPNNVMLIASSANFGVVRTVPHMLGISGGLVMMLMVVGVGLAEVFELYPLLLTILRGLCAVYLLYLAYRIATAAAPQSGEGGKPLTALQAALFQWVNPKAWAMALGAVTVYAPDTTFSSVLMVAVVMGLVSLPSMAIWVVAGTQIARFLRGRRLVIFNWSMAILLVASLLPAFLG